MAAQEQPINVAVVGTGRMGAHHVRTYRNLAGANLLAVVDLDQNRANELANQYGCAACKDVTELLERFPQVQAVTVAVPTVYHVPVASQLLKHGVACLVEKPLAQTSDEAAILTQLAYRHKVTLGVGHTERFNPAVRAVAALGLKPRFMDVQRVSPMTFRSLDIGVVMDMMIHDLDIVLHLVNSPLKRVEAVGMSVISEHEDICNARLVFESGCVANVTASRMALRTERRMRLFSDDAFVNLDYQARTGVVIHQSAHADKLAEIRQAVAAGGDLSNVDYTELVSQETLSMELPEGHDDPLTAQSSTFLDAVRAGTRHLVDGQAGQDVVDVAQQVVQAVREHQWI